MMPPCVDTIFTFVCGWATHMRTWSKHLLEANTANVLAKGTLPQVARPAAMLIIFCSARPHWMKRSGKAWAKYLVMVERDRSASSTTMRGSRPPNSVKNLPKASRVVSSE